MKYTQNLEDLDLNSLFPTISLRLFILITCYNNTLGMLSERQHAFKINCTCFFLLFQCSS